MGVAQKVMATSYLRTVLLSFIVLLYYGTCTPMYVDIMYILFFCSRKRANSGQ